MKRLALYAILTAVTALWVNWSSESSVSQTVDKDQPAKAAQADPAKAAQAAQADPVKSDPAKSDAKQDVKAEPAAADADKSDPAKTDSPATKADPKAEVESDADIENKQPAKAEANAADGDKIDETAEARKKTDAAAPKIVRTKTGMVRTTVWDTYGNFFLAALVIIVPIILANALGTGLRLPEFTWKIWLVLFTVLLSGVIVATGEIKYGIDLRGGAILVYEVDRSQLQSGQTVDMDEMVAAISKRINPGGLQEIVIRKFGVEQIEIIIPGVGEEEARRIQDRLTNTGSLEFRILANNRDHEHVMKAADPDGPRIVTENGVEVAKWIPVAKHEKTREPRFIPQGVPGNPPGQDFHFVRRNAQGNLEVLVIDDVYDVTGSDLSGAFPDQNSQGLPAVGFSFNANGAYRFAQLTGENTPVTGSGQPYDRQLGVVLDGQLYSAPRINQRISERGIIEGDFTQDQVDDLVSVLKAGKLPAALKKEPESRLVTGATLGEDTVSKGKQAISISLIGVLGFMLVYYRFAGVVANIALVLNILYILALMIFFNAVFTLPGIAGLVLTVGMAVDANVLIYERMREELSRGAALRMAIRNGFDRATTTIVDANLTTLITATILYWIGTDQIKGFAVTLWLGIVLSMFTAIFVARLLFDIVDRKRWLTTLSMMRLMTTTNFDFLRWARPAIIASVVVIGAGLATVWARGMNILDIDFTGGTAVQLLFSEKVNPDELPDIAEVREKVSKALPDVVVKNVRLGEEHPRLRYTIDTSLQDIDKVEDELSRVFAGKLSHNELVAFTPVPPKPDATDKDAQKQVYTLKFGEKTDHDTVHHMLTKEIEKLKLGGGASNFALTTPGYTEGSKGVFATWTLSIPTPPDQAETLLASLQKTMNDTAYFPSSNKIGGQVAAATQHLALVAIAFSLVGIVLYLWFRFTRVSFGVAAVVAVVHDVLVTLGALAASFYLAPYLGFLGVDPFKIDLTIIAAFLTIIGYSLNDTIVIFDRIREIRGKSPEMTASMINTSINQTLSRTILTTFTTLIVVVILYIGGGESLRDFSFALLVGLVAGTYSTVFIASPVLLWMYEVNRAAGAREADSERRQTAATP